MVFLMYFIWASTIKTVDRVNYKPQNFTHKGLELGKFKVLAELGSFEGLHSGSWHGCFLMASCVVKEVMGVPLMSLMKTPIEFMKAFLL